MSRQVVDKLLRQIIKEYGKRAQVEIAEDFEYDLVTTRDPSHGDLAANAAFKLARVARQKPSIIADQQ